MLGTPAQRRRRWRPVWASVLALSVFGQLPGCAHIRTTRSLRVAALEAPVASVAVVGEGYQLRAKRDGDAVRVQVAAVKYCQRQLRQRAQGFRVTERQAVGKGLTTQWIMGGMITLAGAAILTYNAVNPAPAPAEGDLGIDYTKRTYLYAGGISAVGLAFLTGSLVQQLSLGRTEQPLGERVLKKQGSVRPCRAKKATHGTLRLTLSDGHQIEAPVGADGLARIPLPADVEARLTREGRRATVEALGDWRSQKRISL